jgi:hypothetical protein
MDQRELEDAIHRLENRLTTLETQVIPALRTDHRHQSGTIETLAKEIDDLRKSVQALERSGLRSAP